MTQSHTILGNKSQRGLTQLTLDVLFRHTQPHLVDTETVERNFSSLCEADVSESQVLTASNFLDGIYDSGPGRFSRATTPMVGVRASTTSSIACDLSLTWANS
jgi:hypothetical protein